MTCHLGPHDLISFYFINKITIYSGYKECNCDFISLTVVSLEVTERSLMVRVNKIFSWKSVTFYF